MTTKEIQAGRKSIYISRTKQSGIYRLLSMHGETGLSQTLNTAISRYLNLIGHCMPDLSTEEWCMILDSQLGLFVSEHWGVEVIGDTTLEAMRIDALDKKWGIDPQRMTEVMTTLTYAEKQCICELIEAYRADDSQDSYPEKISRILLAFSRPEPGPTARPPLRMSPNRLHA